MTTHPADEVLSALVDDMLEPAELADAQAHVSACAHCAQRVEELRSVASLLRRLPAVEPPRSFVLGPRAVADPPNVVRLRRWYAASRVAAATLAAGFVFMAASALYVDSRPAPIATQSAELTALPRGGAEAGAAAPGATGAQPLAARDSAKPAPPPPAFAPAAAPAPTSAPAPAAPAAAGAPAQAAVRSAPAAASNVAPDAADQIAAATSVRPLPTPLPTPTPVVAPTAVPLAARLAPTPQPGDGAAPLRFGAVALGLLAVLAVFAAAIVRHRLLQAASRPL